MHLASILASGLALAGGGPQDAPASLPTVDRYEVYLITIDQGSEVWELFGHNALVIVDRERGVSAAWNWGIFDFQDVDFIPRFLRGTMRYRMAGMDPDAMIRAYIRDNRSVHSHQVLLTQDEARALDEYVAWHDLPENRFYTYDYFRDNCSTRLRDALDLALGGALGEHFRERETPHSYRWHSRRLVQDAGHLIYDVAWVDQGLSFLLGPRGDRPLSEWEVMFVPMELTRLLEGFEREGPDGEVRPLLGPPVVLFEADRPPTPEEAPGFRLGMLVLGFVIGTWILILPQWASGAMARARAERAGDPWPSGGRVRLGPVWIRVILGTVVSGWALFSGVLGAILIFAWFTDHVFIHWNANILQANPLALLIPVFFIPALTSVERAGGAWGRRAAILGLVVGGLSLVGAVARAVTLIPQESGDVIALALPMNLCLGLGLMAFHGMVREAGGGSEPEAQSESP